MNLTNDIKDIANLEITFLYSAIHHMKNARSIHTNIDFDHPRLSKDDIFKFHNIGVATNHVRDALHLNHALVILSKYNHNITDQHLGLSINHILTIYHAPMSKFCPLSKIEDAIKALKLID